MLTAIGAGLCAGFFLAALVLHIMSRNMRNSGAPLALAYEKATRRLAQTAFSAGVTCGIITTAIKINQIWIFF